jgi:hypothetical protein
MAAAAVSAMLVGACGGGASSLSASGDISALHRAAEGMLSLRSMTATITTTPDPGGQAKNGQQTATVYYQAPDRMEGLSGTGQQMTVTQVVAGGSVYIAQPFQPGYFQEVPGASPQKAIDTFLAPFRQLAKATNARRDGNRYHVSTLSGSGGTASTFDATVTNGLIQAFTLAYSLQGKPYKTRLVFSAFNSSPPVAPPPADLVVAAPQQSQPAPPCPVGQPSNGRCTPQFHPVALPPVGPVHSTLQFRPVLDDHAAGCGSNSGQNPDPSITVSLPGPQPGTCLRLGPAALSVTHAQTTPTQDQAGQVQLNFTLDASDAARFDQLAQANYQRQVAVVMFGHVLSAPTIRATSFGGQGQITGLTVDQAAHAAAALNGK